jgi:hypothetical protein
MPFRLFLAALLMLTCAAAVDAQTPPPKELGALPAPPQVNAPPPIPQQPGATPTQPATSVVPPTRPPAPTFTFKFKIDVNASLSGLLPAAPKTPARLPAWTNEDLAKVPELAFADPIGKDLDKMKAMEQTAHILAKVNHLNCKKTDGFLLALLEERGDLRGLPFLMGEECRTRDATAFRQMADIVNRALVQCKANPIGGSGRGVGPASSSISVDVTQADQLWAAMSNINGQLQRGDKNNAGKDHVNRAMVAALTQILMPESEHYRVGLANFLSTVPHADATKALTRLAIFSPEDAVRAAAIESLKTRREKDYTEILMSGFTYPLPAVSKRAAEALVKLERKDLLESLLRVLEAPDPRLPVKVKEKSVVRELVKVNHHRNCVLCHAPGNTENMPEGVLTVAVPLPGEPLPRPSQGGYQSTPPPSPDIVVRIDMTYLRQDFSMMMPVANPEPWPEMQRFDFLVRTRTLTAAEAQAYEPCCEEEEPGRLSPYHRAALYALRELTGRDTEPMAAAWRKLLKLPKTAS